MQNPSDLFNGRQWLRKIYVLWKKIGISGPVAPIEPNHQRNWKVTVSPSSRSDPEFVKHLFLLSFHDRDPLASRISSFGWQVSSARRGKGLRNRFQSSNALIAVIDLRRSDTAGLAAIAEIAGFDEQDGIAILALANQAQQTGIAGKCHDAGATHFLDMGAGDADLQQAINFAFRYVENMRGGSEVAQNLSVLLAQTDERWSFPKTALNRYWISKKLREHLSAKDLEYYPVTGFYRNLSTEERLRVRGAMGRLQTGSAQAAVAHMLNGGKVIHHLHDSGDEIHGRVERVSSTGADGGWAERDLLSGLRNGSAARSWMRNKLEQGSHLGLIALGLKNFGTINAAYGRAVGDEIMRRIGQRLISETSDHDADECLVARMDGQNFVIVMTMDQTPRDYPSFAEQLLAKIFEPVSIEGRTIRLVARAGVALGHDSSDESVLIRRGILALAEAMVSDSTPIKISDSSEKDVLLEQQLEGELAHALERGEIAISFQPQIKIDTGQLIGAEALARWNHPKLGFLGAGTLFSVAERAGLMELLSSHIHNLALTTATRWPESLAFLRLSINVTAGDLANRHFVTRMMENIAQSGFSADRTTLEITESELINDLERASQHLAKLQENGFRIAIDDFGTGYSSLAYLKNLPFDYLKLDSGLTGDISGSAKDQVVVKSIIDMAHSLGLSVIAEGVETEEQLETLTEQGCQYFQGFLRSGPLVPEEFEIFALRSN